MFEVFASPVVEYEFSHWQISTRLGPNLYETETTTELRPMISVMRYFPEEDKTRATVVQVVAHFRKIEPVEPVESVEPETIEETFTISVDETKKADILAKIDELKKMVEGL